MKAVKGYRGLYIDQRGIYKVRVAIPEKAQKRFRNKKEINKSLKTRDINMALPLYHDIMRQITHDFKRPVYTTTSKDLPEFPNDLFEEQLLKSVYHHFRQFSGIVQNEFLKQMIKENNSSNEIDLNHHWICEKNQEWLRTSLAELRTGVASESTNLMIDSLTASKYRLTQVQRNKAKTAFAQTIFDAASCYKTLYIDVSCLDINEYSFRYDIVREAYKKYSTLQPEYQNSNNSSEKHKEQLSAKNSITVANILAQKRGMEEKPTKIIDILDLWVKEKSTFVEEKVPHIKHFIVSFSDKEKLDDITGSDIRDWLDILELTPKNMNKLADFKGLSIAEAIEKNKTVKRETLSKKTINNYLNSFSIFHQWAKRKCLITSSNPTYGFAFSKKETMSPPPILYSKQEIIKIINYLNKSKNNNIELYWAVLIVIYSGMREAEVAQLDAKDINQRDGVLYFDINDYDGKKIKNHHSKRKVPVHKELIKLGIIDYINHCKKQENTRLFPSFIPFMRGERKVFDKCFAEKFDKILKELNLKVSKRRLHSIRHTFIDMMRANGLTDEEIQHIVGHENQIMTNRYGSLAPVKHIKIYKEWIDDVDYYRDDSIQLKPVIRE